MVPEFILRSFEYQDLHSLKFIVRFSLKLLKIMCQTHSESQLLSRVTKSAFIKLTELS